MAPRDRDRDIYPPRRAVRDDDADTDPPDSPAPDSDRDEVTSVSLMAIGGNVIAVKLKHLESQFAAHKRETEKTNEKRELATDNRFKDLEKHFEEKGMVMELRDDVKIAKSWIRGLPWVMGLIYTVLTVAAGGVWYMIHSSERDHDLQLLQQAAKAQPVASAPK